MGWTAKDDQDFPEEVEKHGWIVKRKLVRLSSPSALQSGVAQKASVVRFM